MKKRKDGLYQSQITITTDGVKKQKYFYGKTQAEVRKKMLSFEAEKSRSRTFQEVADEWQESHEQTIQYYTTHCYKAPIKDVTTQFGNMSIPDITPQKAQNFINTYAAMGRAQQTVKLRLIVLRLIFRHAVIKGDISQSPVEYVKIPKGLKSQRGKTVPQEIIARIQANADEANGLFPYFLLYTGCRRSEALAVRYEDIDFKQSRITINKKVEFHGEMPVVVEKTKTQKSNRTIIMLERLKEKIPTDKKGYLFTGKQGLLHKSELRHIWENLDLGITLHQLRHAYVTMLYDAGIDEETAMTQTGHANISVMRDVYTHIREEKIVQTAEILNKFKY